MNSLFSAPAHDLRAAGKPCSVAPRDRFLFSTKPLLKYLALALALSAAPEAMAVDRYFDCVTGSVQTATCWSGNIKPGATDTAFIGYSSFASNVTAALASGSFTPQYEYIGYSGYNGTVNHSGGTSSSTSSTSFISIGEGAGLTGIYNLSGTGIVEGRSMYVGMYGTGIFNQTSGNVTAQQSMFVGTKLGSSGSYTLQSGTLTVGSLAGVYSVENIGSYGMGSFIQSGGTHTSYDILMGRYAGSSGSYNLSGGNLNIERTLLVGEYGIANFTHSAGTNQASDLLLMASQGGSGTYNLSGTANLITDYVAYGHTGGTNVFNQSGGTHNSAYEYLGYLGDSTYNQSGGTHTVSSTFVMGSYAGGTYNLRGGMLTVNAPTGISNGAGTSTLNIDGGTLTVGGGNGSIDVDNLYLGSAAGFTGSHILSGTGTFTASNEYIGNSGSGTFTQTGGTHTVTSTLAIAQNAGSSGTYNLQGGLLDASIIDIVNAGTATFNFTGGTLAVDQFTGNLVNNGGTLAPGNSPGTTNITGDYTQMAAGIFDVEIGGLLAGTEYDVLNVSGTASLDGTLNVSLFDLGSGLFAPQAGDSFDILTAEILSGSFSTLSYAALLDPNLSWQIDYLTDAIGTTDVVRLSVVSAVPVPGAVWLFGSGLLGLIGVARRKKK